MGTGRCKGRSVGRYEGGEVRAGASGHEWGRVQTEVTNGQTEHMYKQGRGDMSPLPPITLLDTFLKCILYISITSKEENLWVPMVLWVL
jgi:hypothetical protein